MLGLLSKLLIKIMGGSRNDRIVRARLEIVTQQMNPLEPKMRELSDDQMRSYGDDLRARLADGADRDQIRAEAFALVREASWRGINIRHFDVQLVAGMILDSGWITEEATGEGKTFACYPAVFMAVIEGMKAHVVTTNDYLVQRDAELAKPVFELLGISVGFIQSDMPAYGEGNQGRREAYACDITYGTPSEFGFDYLRDNMKTSAADQVQGRLDFAIIDEVDNILIDEARTPLIISGLAHGESGKYAQADGVARELISRNRDWDRGNEKVESLNRQIRALEGEAAKSSDDEAVKKNLSDAQDQLAGAEADLRRCIRYYEIELDRKSVHMTHEGVGAAQDIAGVGSFYVGANMDWPHLVEQSLRAHLVYEKDRDYVVQDGTVVIVDEFTGRLLAGRQWSDGLHQAAEAKERVQIKRETQTEATVTLQNFFKMYKRLAGMTGTAMTEADEFMKIFKLDVVAVQTHRPVNRVDHNDRIYADTEAKFEAIVEEVNHYSKLGRPILVGTTSIEKSEKLSAMLTRTYGIEHEVLNARPENAGREADIVLHAGQQRPLKRGSKEFVGNVTIATNMAGRGTDIKLGPGVVWANCHVPEPEKFTELGLEPEELFPAGTNKCCIHCTQYDPSTNCSHCFKPKIDSAFPARGRGDCVNDVPCGLHIVGTERHEARRIDNQLRGRSGRQGDPGSSRFFLSIRDELMAIFAGEWTLKVLGWLGLQGDAAIEDKRISKGIERAQKKVEQRNFEIRKNLLEYDEVMDYQRRTLYGQRQDILDGRDLREMVRQMIQQSVGSSVEEYLDGRYVKRCIADWARQQLQIPLRDDQVRVVTIDGLGELQRDLRNRAKDEVTGVVAITLGEYMGEDIPSNEWDLRGLSSWAMSRFGVNLSQNQLRKMSPDEVEAALVESASQRIDAHDLSGLAEYLDGDYALQSLAQWAQAKFGLEIDPDELTSDPQVAESTLSEKVEAAYHQREIECPVDYALDLTIAQAGTENVYALGQLADWANLKFQAGIDPHQLQGLKIEDIRADLLKLSDKWTSDETLSEAIVSKVGESPSVDDAVKLASERFDTQLTQEDFDSDVQGRLMEVGRNFLRREMTELERFVLLQIVDTAWREHLLDMDHLKSGIGLRSYAEQDPRIAYKREGARMFQEMFGSISDKVTEMIFKVRLAAGEKVSSVYQVNNLVHEQLSAYDQFTQKADEQGPAGETQKIKTITRNVPKVGRNDPCPCGSGKKYKKCCAHVG